MKDQRFFDEAATEAATELISSGTDTGYLYVDTSYAVTYSRKIDLCRPQIVRYYFSPTTGVIFNGRTLL